jgi:dienelactone hydrolase
MKRAVIAKLVMGLLLSTAWSAPAWAQTLTSFTTTYKGGSGTCGTTYSIQGKEPSSTSRYPVFIYMVGTSETYNNASALAAVDEMAGRGYVAATVQYPNSTFGSCSTLAARSKCIFDSTSASSAVAALCSRPAADCSKGIVVAGFSQGSILAILAKNHDARVQAAYGLGAGVQYSTYDLRACVANGKRTLTSDRLRAVNGEADGFMGGAESSVRGQLQELTGRSCTSTSCFASNGSGWYIVKHAEVSDGNADHCYMRATSGCSGSQNSLDQKWLNGTYDWSADPNLQWLTGFTQP